MKTLSGIVLGIVLALSLSALAIPISQQTAYPFPPSFTQNVSRACVFQPGAWTNVACTGTGVAAESAALDQWVRYVIQCPQNSYIRTGTTTTQATPTTSDGYLPSGAWLEFATTDTLVYVGCLPQATQTGCQLWECK